MQKVRLAMVGAGGYANHYLDLLKDMDPASFTLIGIVDPFIEKSPKYEMLKQKKIPFFDTIEELYEQQPQIDAVCIASPPLFHKQQSLVALHHGSAVLCEKPIVPLVQDALELEQAQRASHRQIGVGFQWCFSEALTEAKHDILADRFGKPILLKSLVSWPRDNRYYSSWHGHLKAGDGSFLLDSVATNAMAHYLFNIFYILGDTPETSKAPEWIRAGLYRAKEIDSFDTCTLHGGFANGAEFLFFGTHASDQPIQPTFEYRFEKGTLYLDENDGTSLLRARMNDGSEKVYGPMVGNEIDRAKLTALFANATGTGTFPCDVTSVLPQVEVTNFLFEHFPITPFAEELTADSGTVLGRVMPGINEVFRACFNQECTPGKLGVSWAKEDRQELGDYRYFDGVCNL